MYHQHALPLPLFSSSRIFSSGECRIEVKLTRKMMGTLLAPAIIGMEGRAIAPAIIIEGWINISPANQSRKITPENVALVTVAQAHCGFFKPLQRQRIFHLGFFALKFIL